MYSRVPGTLKDALTEIKLKIGAEAMAEAVGKTPSLIQKWTNPEKEIEPSLRQALQLDVACLKACGLTPVRDWYLHHLGESDQPAPRRDLQRETLDVMSATGELAAKINEVMNEKGPRGRAISHNEATAVLRAAREVRKQAEEVEQAVQPFVAH